MDDGTETNLSKLHSEETKYALFAEWTHSRNAFSASVGLRYEMFKMRYTDKLSQSILEDCTYNRLYPYVSWSYSGKVIKMGLSLSTKVKRQSYYLLRNSTEYLNRYEMEMGNPLLLPQYTTGLSYNAKYWKLTFAVDYQWVSDYIMSCNIVSQPDPLVSVSKPVIDNCQMLCRECNRRKGGKWGHRKTFITTEVYRIFSLWVAPQNSDIRHTYVWIKW